MFLYKKEFTTSKEYLDFYLKHYGKFRVQKFYESIPQRWQLYGTPNCNYFLKKYKFVNAREIFPDEIVIDIDADKEMSQEEKKKDALEHTRLICGKLKRMNIYYTMWDSGGDGYHIHAVFPEIRKLATTDLEVSWLKENLLKYMVENVKTEGLYSKVCHVKKTLISLELSPHRKGHGSKNIIEYFGIGEGFNTIPKQIKDRFAAIKEKSVMKAFRKYETKSCNTIFEEEAGTPDCIKFFLEREIKDGRHRMLFILVNFFKGRMNKKELTEFIHKWNKYVHNGHLSDKEITDSISYHYGNKARPGVRYYKTLLDDIGYSYVYKNCKHCQSVLRQSFTDK